MPSRMTKEKNKIKSGPGKTYLKKRLKRFLLLTEFGPAMGSP